MLQDPLYFETPTRSPVRPAAPLDPGTASGKREVSFEPGPPSGDIPRREAPAGPHL